jgi:hypothetical protein
MMRKRIVGGSKKAPTIDQSWLGLEHLARVEITSEEEGHPIEAALIAADGPGWQANGAGEQTIRLLFDRPQTLKRIHLAFEEDGRERTHEFVLRWSADEGRSFREIVRQQYTFSPPDTTRQVEDYAVNLDKVTVLELRIVPDISGGDARASLMGLRLA